MRRRNVHGDSDHAAAHSFFNFGFVVIVAVKRQFVVIVAVKRQFVVIVAIKLQFVVIVAIKRQFIVIVVIKPPAFSCDAGGYLIQLNTLYRLDLETGVMTTVNEAVGDEDGINAIGYNVLDNYIWGVQELPSDEWQLIRIDSDGNGLAFDLVVPAADGYQAGDVDLDGQLWLWSADNSWLQIDLDPTSATYLQLVDSGTSTLAVTGIVSDWVALADDTEYLYSVQEISTTNSSLVRWSKTTHDWSVVSILGNVDGRQVWGALYPVGDHFYGSENNVGDIYSFYTNGSTPTFVTEGPTSGSNDGARCALAPAP
ncbi:hypothetical protein SCUCBS95973_002340 [Sporothrix curviconia]|uniref:DUF6923 domain-containing protein n=1 Tax=Sporothrix curviconia TaxID=1260050 RepID=A0ABP0B6U7_9PEZI